MRMTAGSPARASTLLSCTGRPSIPFLTGLNPAMVALTSANCGFERAFRLIRWLRARGIGASELEEIDRVGTERLSYEQITSLVRATQPPRPSWWDEGHEHDLTLVDAHLPPRSGAEINYWARVANVRDALALQRRGEHLSP